MSDHPIPAAALEQHNAILGRSGSGKSYTARGIAERLIAEGRRVCIIDPTSAWWGLRLNAAGDGPSEHEIAIFGGPRGDLPLADTAAAALADVLASTNLPSIIDLSDLSKSKQRSFMAAFLERLYEVNRDVLHLIIDEADLFVPQRVAPEMARLVGAVDDIVRRGRIMGFRVTMITQRAAVINKDVLSQIGLLVAMRSASPQDRAALEGWFEGHGDKAQARAVFDSLGSLARGEAWLWAPDLGLLERATMPINTTYDSSATPAFGQAAPKPVTLAQIDLTAIRAALAPPEPKAAPAKREAVAGVDPLEARVAALEAGPTGAGQLSEIIGKLLTPFVQAIADAALQLEERLVAVDTVSAGAGSPPPPTVPADQRPVVTNSPSPPPAQAREPQPAPEGLTKGAVKMLTKLAELHPRPMTLEQLAKLTGISTTSSQWRANRLSFEAAPMVERKTRGRFVLSVRGAAEMLGSSHLPTNPLEQWVAVLPPSTGRLLRALVAHPTQVERSWLAMHAGISPTSSQLGGGLRELVENGLAEQVERGLYRATDAVR